MNTVIILTLRDLIAKAGAVSPKPKLTYYRHQSIPVSKDEPQADKEVNKMQRGAVHSIDKNC